MGFKIQRIMNVPMDTPLIMAKKKLEYVITHRDIKRAVPGDPFCCVHAEAAKRTTGAIKVYFGRSVAWLLFKLENGSLELHKYVMWAQDQRVAKTWDEGKGADVKHVTLHPVTSGRTPEAVAKRERKTRREIRKMVKLGATREEAKEAIQIKGRIKKKPKRKIARPSHSLWRTSINQHPLH